MKRWEFGLLRIPTSAAYGSAIVAAIGVLFLVLMYADFLTPAKGLRVFGPLNDACVLVQYALALPIVVALHRLLTQHSPHLRVLALIFEVGGAAGTIVFQAVLLSGLLPFRQQVLYAAASLLVVGIWVLTTGVMGRRSGILQGSVPLLVLAAPCFGYPIWAYRLGQQLRQRVSGSR
jgi:hypothetical protein